MIVKVRKIERKKARERKKPRTRALIIIAYLRGWEAEDSVASHRAGRRLNGRSQGGFANQWMTLQMDMESEDKVKTTYWFGRIGKHGQLPVK